MRPPANNGDSPVRTGIVGSIRNLADGLVGTVQDRLELVAVELQEEKIRLIEIFFLINLALITAALALTFLGFALIVLFWDHARIAVAGSLAAACASICLVAAFVLFRKLASQPRMLDAAREEIARDRACIHPDR
jgi:uncharacterized membrane protein YqjE